MGLDVFANLDPATLFTGGNYDPQGGSLFVPGSQPGKWIYYDRLDVFMGEWNPGTGAFDFCRWDPLLLTNTGGLFDDVPRPSDIGGTAARSVAVGEWDRGANVQKVYQASNSVITNAPHNEINPLALDQVVATAPFPNVGHLNSIGKISTDIGYYDQTNLNDNKRFIFFETWGYAFATGRVRHTDNVQYAEVAMLIDLATGGATILTDLPVAYGTQTHQFAEPQLFAQNVYLGEAQFVPDDASTPAAPRGRLLLYSVCSDKPGDATRTRCWVKIVDWNPLAVAATPSRVHLRERLVSAVEFLKTTPGSLNGIHEGGTPIRKHLMYHPLSNRFYFYSSIAGGPSGGQLDAGESKFLFVTASPAVTALSDPSPTETPATGKTVSFLTEAYGSLAEKIGGVNVAFQLRRISTVDEVLTIVPATPGQTVALANGPIIPDDPNLSPVVVKKDGTPLTETVHYNLDRPNGEIDFIGPEPTDGPVYTCTYRHFDTPASPAHGTLLNASAVTDLGGAAVARVKYAEESSVPDRWDRIDAT